MEAIFTQLVLQHALRIRVVAEAKSESSPASTSAAPTPPTHSAAPSISGDHEAEGSSDSSDTAAESTITTAESEATAVASNAPASASKDAGKSTAEAALAPKDTATQKSLIGRMNNLISSDLQAIGKATEFIQIVVASPLMVFGTITFLYTILGWSALAGFGVMLLMMPLPAFASSRLQWVSREVAKKVCNFVSRFWEILTWSFPSEL